MYDYSPFQIDCYFCPIINRNSAKVLLHAYKKATTHKGYAMHIRTHPIQGRFSGKAGAFFTSKHREYLYLVFTNHEPVTGSARDGKETSGT